MSGELLDAAIEYARTCGAPAIEGYPKTGVSRHARAGGRAEQNDSFMGRLGSYESRQFVTIRESNARALMRKELHS